MRRIIVDFPDDCTEQEAAVYASGCFNPHMNDFKKLREGYRNGVSFQYGDGRYGYCYKTMQGNYVLKLERKE